MFAIHNYNPLNSSLINEPTAFVKKIRGHIDSGCLNRNDSLLQRGSYSKLYDFNINNKKVTTLLSSSSSSIAATTTKALNIIDSKIFGATKTTTTTPIHGIHSNKPKKNHQRYQPKLFEMNAKLRNNESTSIKRGLPILLILVCSLVIVNTKCDSVGSSNDKKSSKVSEASDQEEQLTTPKKTKIDPLSMLREIYLDHNSKVITMLLPTEGDPVQKFHPNGRYGRRSVDNFAESRSELGKLVYNEPPIQSIDIKAKSPMTRQQATLRSILHGINRDFKDNVDRIPISTNQNQAESMRMGNNINLNNSKDFNSNLNYPLEMNKLLRCNYVGVSNLYACNAAIN